MSKNIVFEGWLTKSPPSKRIWRTKWRRRWFALRQSGELPGQYFLDYYADRNCRRLKGTINLDFCEQVDAGLHMERGSHSSLDSTLRGSVFTIQTQTRTYHLEADCEADMERWVDAICRVCGLRPTDDGSNAAEVYQNHSVTVSNQENIALRVLNKNRGRRTGKKAQQPLMLNASTMTNDLEEGFSTEPYIPISECVTGVPDQDDHNFDSKNRATNPKKRYDNNKRRICRQPQIKINDVPISDTELHNLNEEGCSSISRSVRRRNYGDGKVAKTFTKLSLAPRKNNSVSEDGPPVPPRPAQTLSMGQNVYQTKYLQTQQYSMEPPALPERNKQYLSVPGLACRVNTPPSPRHSVLNHSIPESDEENETVAEATSHYCNVHPPPPPVDRSLKPRLSSLVLSPGSIPTPETVVKVEYEPKPADKLQYVVLDLPPSTSNSQDVRKSSIESPSSDADSAYKTVDFVKTEVLNTMEEKIEASEENML